MAVDQAPVLSVTADARAAVLEQLAHEDDSPNKALFVEVSGASGSGFVYDMWFDSMRSAKPADIVQDDGELRVVIIATSALSLQGATLGVSDEGLVITNPNTPPANAKPAAAGSPFSIPAGPVLLVSDAARAFIATERANEANASELALYLEVSGTNDGIYTYDMWFESVNDATDKDAVIAHDDLSVIVMETSIDKIRGSMLDLGAEGLFITNPNFPTAPQSAQSINVPVSDLSKPIERAVIYVLDNDVNPQIAMHGGAAQLVAVDEEGVAYVRLSGGCQGCGLASVTLSQGIAVALKDALPEITDVIDVTDHELGDNPYFAGAKK